MPYIFFTYLYSQMRDYRTKENDSCNNCIMENSNMENISSLVEKEIFFKPTQGKFLTAKWEYLVMMNYAVDEAVLLPHLPPYTQIDLFEGKALVSIVGFLFTNTKVFGLQWPFHINFEEVNLRYYLKRSNTGNNKDTKRGVGFISEIVPKPCIAHIANTLYNEHYSVAKMSHNIVKSPTQIEVSFNWQTAKTGKNSLMVQAQNQPRLMQPGTAESFIFEHYYGYNKLNSHTTIEYGVEHPAWRTYEVTQHALNCNVAALYGKEFEPFIIDANLHSVFLAEGSQVLVRKPVYLRGD